MKGGIGALPSSYTDRINQPILKLLAIEFPCTLFIV